MASIVRRHPAAHAHAHFRRVKPSTKPETTLAQASPQKPASQENKQNISKLSQKAKVNRKCFEGNAKRTNIPNQLRSKSKWKKQFK